MHQIFSLGINQDYNINNEVKSGEDHTEDLHKDPRAVVWADKLYCELECVRTEQLWQIKSQ